MSNKKGFFSKLRDALGSGEDEASSEVVTHEVTSQLSTPPAPAVESTVVTPAPTVAPSTPKPKAPGSAEEVMTTVLGITRLNGNAQLRDVAATLDSAEFIAWLKTKLQS
jgi:hypothetical protein